MKKIFYLLFLLALGFPAFSQSVTWTWSFGLYGTSGGGGEINGFVQDATDSMIVVGEFGGTGNFNPLGGTTNVTATSGGYFAKYSATGINRWVYQFGGTGDCDPFDVGLDAAGNIFICGRFDGTVDFDPGISTINLTSSGSRDLFIAKYNSVGAYQWAIGIGSTAFDESFDLAIDANGDVAITGILRGMADFDPTIGIANLTPTGTSDVFLAKYSSTGNFQWAFNLEAPGDDFGFSVITTSTNDFVLGGRFSSTIDLDPGVGTNNFTTNGLSDLFFAKYSNAGVHQWGYALGGAGYDDCFDVGLDGSDNIYICGDFSQTMDLDPSGAVANHTVVGSVDMYVGKYTSAGDYIWSISMGGTNGEAADCIHVLPNGDFMIGGRHNGTVDMDPGPNTVYIGGPSDCFGAGYTSAGAFNFAFKIGSAGTDQMNEVLLEPNADIFVAGQITGLTDMDPTGQTHNISPGISNTAGFIGRYHTCPAPPAPTNTTPAQNLSICEGNSTTLSASGIVGNLSWYSSMIGGTYLGGGSTFTTPVLNASTAFYAQDSGCASSPRQSIVVSVDPLPSTYMTVFPNFSPVCYGSLITLTENPSANTVFTWNPSTVVSGVPFHLYAAQTFYITGTDVTTGCTSMDSVHYDVIPNPTVSVNVTPSNSVCEGELVTITATGAQYYNWDHGVTNGGQFQPLNTQTYTVIATAVNNCKDTASVTVTVNPPPTISVQASPSTTICPGDQVTLTGTGAPTIIWDSGYPNGTPFTPTFSTIYTATGTSAQGCIGTATLQVDVIEIDPNVTPSGNTLFAYQSNGQYQWINCNTLQLIAGATSQSFAPSASGSYAAIITLFGCTDTTNCENFNFVGMEATQGWNAIKAFPNPTKGIVWIETSAGFRAGRFVVRDVMGRQMQQGAFGTAKDFQVDFSDYPAGVYFISISAGKQDGVIKIVKE